MPSTALKTRDPDFSFLNWMGDVGCTDANTTVRYNSKKQVCVHHIVVPETVVLLLALASRDLGCTCATKAKDYIEHRDVSGLG